MTVDSLCRLAMLEAATRATCKAFHLMKIDAAKERITDGAVADGAAGLLRSLDTRIQLYVQKNAPDVR